MDILCVVLHSKTDWKFKKTNKQANKTKHNKSKAFKHTNKNRVSKTITIYQPTKQIGNCIPIQSVTITAT